MKSKNFGDGQGDGQGEKQTRNLQPVKEKTLLEIYEEAMKETPKDIEELGIGGTTRKVTGDGGEANTQPRARITILQRREKEKNIDGTSQIDKEEPKKEQRKTWAEARSKARKVTERINGGTMAFQLAKAKASREAITACSKEGARVQQTFAQVVHRYAASHQEDKAPPTRPKPQQAISSQPKIILNHHILGFKEQKAKQLLQNEDGWTTVCRRKIRSPRRTIYLSPQQKILKENNKCFNCFVRGHKKANWKNKVRCINCDEIGHISRYCPKKSSTIFNKKENPQGVTAATNQARKNQPNLIIKEKQPENLQSHKFKPQNNLQNTHLTPQKPQPKENMDISNWETIELMNPDLVEIERGEDLEVFINPRVELLPPNTPLYRTAIVLAGPNQNDAFLAHRIATRLASYFRKQPRDFKVRKAHSSVGDYFAIFPTYDMMKEATDVCVFTLGLGIEVQLTQWTREASMIYDPSSNLARIKLYGVPPQNWNIHDTTDIVSVFGELKKMSPVNETENYEFIHVLVDCHNPKRVPRYLTARAGDYKAPVDVVLDGWFYTSEPNHPPPRRENTREGSPDNCSTTARQNAAPYARNRTTTRDRPSAINNHHRRNGHGEELDKNIVELETSVNQTNGETKNLEVRQGTNGESILTVTSFQMEHAAAGVYGELNVTSTLGEQLRIVITADIPRAVCGLFIETNGTFPSKWHQKSPFDLLWKRHAFNSSVLSTIEVPNGRKKEESFSKGLLMGPIVSQGQQIEETFLEIAQQAENMAGPIYLGPAAAKEKEVISHINQEQLLSLDVLNLGPDTGEENLANSPIRQTSPILNESLPVLSEINGESQTGSPPGYSGPPRYVRGPVRHSARLSAKNKGPYLCPEERARRVSKPYSVSFHKKRQTRKHNLLPVMLDYLKSLDPLSDNQAEAVLAQAGIALNEQMEKIALEAITVE